MKAKFDDQLTLKAAGQWLEACGPLEWNARGGPTDAKKVIVTVRIAQNDVVAQGTSADFDNSQTEWMVYVRPGHGQQFQAGPAEGIGTLTVTDPSATGTNRPKTFSWRGSPTLKF